MWKGICFQYMKVWFNLCILIAHVGVCVVLSFHKILIVQNPIFVLPSFTFHLCRIFGVINRESF